MLIHNWFIKTFNTYFIIWYDILTYIGNQKDVSNMRVNWLSKIADNVFRNFNWKTTLIITIAIYFHLVFARFKALGFFVAPMMATNKSNYDKRIHHHGYDSVDIPCSLFKYYMNELVSKCVQPYCWIFDNILCARSHLTYDRMCDKIKRAAINKREKWKTIGKNEHTTTTACMEVRIDVVVWLLLYSIYGCITFIVFK